MVDREKIEERRSEVLLELHAKEAFERLYDTMILDEYEHYMESYGEAPDPSDLPTEELKAHHYTCFAGQFCFFLFAIAVFVQSDNTLNVKGYTTSSICECAPFSIESKHK